MSPTGTTSNEFPPQTEGHVGPPLLSRRGFPAKSDAAGRALRMRKPHENLTHLQSISPEKNPGDVVRSRAAPARRIPLCEPVLGEPEKRRLMQCIDSGFVSSVGPMVEEFERQFAARVGTRHAVATASGTAALHAALRALGVGSGDRVIVPDLTFVASMNPVLYCSAEPVLVDVDRDTWCLDPRLFRDTCRERARRGRPVRAVVPVHLYGCACDMPAILRTAQDLGIAVVEDATEGLGTLLNGRQVGTFGRLGCFSFNGNKMLTTGAGGMVVTDDGELAARVRYLISQARDSGEEYAHGDLGYNYRMSNLAAALGVAQLERLQDHVAAKRRIAARYRRALESMPGVRGHPEPPGVENCFWLYSIVLDSPARRDAWARGLAARGIQTRRFFTPLHKQAYRRTAVRSRPHRAGEDAGTAGEYLAARGLHLPSSPDLTEDDQEFVIEEIRRLAGDAAAPPRDS